MSDAPSPLHDIYTHELQDLWSANDQMAATVDELAKSAGDDRLRTRLEKSIAGINKHTQEIKKLLEAAGGSVSKEHCKGMQGLAAEAIKHGVDQSFPDPDARDVVIVAQYQRMSHYGIAGFGTAAAYAEALGRKADASKLDQITKDIYQADENMTDLAERSLNLQAKTATVDA